MILMLANISLVMMSSHGVRTVAIPAAASLPVDISDNRPTSWMRDRNYMVTYISISYHPKEKNMSHIVRKPVYAPVCEQQRCRSACASVQYDPHSMISAFVVPCLDSIIPLLAIAEIASLYVVSVAEQAGWSLTWSQTPMTGFFVMGLKQIHTSEKMAVSKILKFKQCSLTMWATLQKDLSSGFVTSYDSNRPGQLMRLARILKCQL